MKPFLEKEVKNSRRQPDLVPNFSALIINLLDLLSIITSPLGTPLRDVLKISIEMTE